MTGRRVASCGPLTNMTIEPVHIPGSDFATASLVELLRRRARTRAGRVAYTFLPAEPGAAEEGVRVSLTYGELDERVRSVAGLVQAEGARGSRARRCCPRGLDYGFAVF